jgi:uncharacterized membrane protein YphA (DoxX/SURF4 family)/thiol-disulfide isomerase/thioredoxin
VDKQQVRAVAAWVLAIALAGLWFVSGVWKLYSPSQESIRLVLTGVPAIYALPFAIVLGSLEMFAGLLLLAPNWRRLGALLSGGMFAAFMIYMGVNYSKLKGVDCGCMPGEHRALDTLFFVEDGLMLAAAVVAFFLARPAAQFLRRSLARPLVALALILAVGAGSAALEITRDTSMSLRVRDRSGQVGEMSLSPRSYTLLYFYSPTCTDCEKASPRLGKLHLSVPLIVVPAPLLGFVDTTVTAYDYLKQAGIKNATVSLDYTPLADKFGLKKVPVLYVMKGGRPVDVILDFEPAALEKALRAYGLVG